MPWFCALCTLLALLAMQPRVEMGVNDDFSYIYSAKVLAETGHIVYNGWASPILGWLLYWGALFIHLFGFSFTVVRASVMVVAVLTVPLLHALFTRLGVSVWNATVATLAVALSPVYLGLAASFMTDVPSLFCLLLCCYSCVRAIEAESDRAAALWIASAAATNLLGGTVRQIVWLGVLLVVPCAAWTMRKRRYVVVTATTAWAVSFAAIVALLRWFSRQPYAAVESAFGVPLTHHGIHEWIKNLVKVPATVLFLALPLLVALGARISLKDRQLRRKVLIALTVLAVILLLGLRIHGGLPWMGLLLGNYVTRRGLIYVPQSPGLDPATVPTAVQALLAFLLLSFGLFAAVAFRQLSRTPSSTAPSENAIDRVSLVVFGPFCLAYTALILTRNGIFDRYFLPILCFAFLAVARFYQRHRHDGLSRWSLAAIALFALYSVTGLHDAFAARRAWLGAANQLIRNGVPRSEILAGFEYDGWTEIESAGHLNNPRLRRPAGAYQPWTPPPALAEECVYPFQDYAPAIHARFGLLHQPGPCFPLAPITPVTYTTWLPPRQHSIYFAAIPSALR